MIIDPILENELEMEPKIYSYDAVDKNKPILVFVKENVVLNSEYKNIILPNPASHYLGNFED